MRIHIASVGKFFSSHSRLAAAIAAGVALTSFAPAANALSYSTTGSPTQFSLGDEIGILSIFDVLQTKGASGTNLSSNTDILLNKLTFTAGFNGWLPASYNYSFTEKVTIGSGTATLTVPFTISINALDTLKILGGTTISILTNGNVWNVVVNALTMSNPGGTETASLFAHVTESPAATPLPAALVLFGSGLGAMGFFTRRRKSKTSAVSAGLI